MTRIKDVLGFYDHLHKLETLHVNPYEGDGRGCEGYKYKYGLDNYERDSPEIIALRAMLGIHPEPANKPKRNLINDKACHGIHRERLNAAMLKKKISQPQLAQWLPITYYSLVMKLRRDSFYMREVFLIENVLGVKEGYLLIVNEIPEAYKRGVKK